MDISKGLARVFSDWSGAGSLFAALASVSDATREWTPKDIRSRATRVLLLENTDLLERLPRTYSEWMEWLPISTQRTGSWNRRISGRPDWRKTALRKWPPDEVFVRRKRRVADNLPASVLAWTYEIIRMAWVPHRDKGSTAKIDELIEVLEKVLSGMEGVDTTQPSEAELSSLAGIGGPWPTVAELANRLRKFEKSGAEEYARRLIQPDIADRVFQLAVLGESILGLEKAGHRVVSLKPISGVAGPVYASEDGRWDIWWEASSIWSYRGLPNMRQEIAKEAFSSGGRVYAAKPDRPDVLIVGKSSEALVLECKFPDDSGNHGYVASGMSQAYFYAQQLSNSVGQVEAFSIGPASLVKNLSRRTLNNIPVGMGSDRHVEELVNIFVRCHEPVASG